MAKETKNTKPVADGEILDFSEVRPFDPLDSKAMYKVRVSNLENVDASTGKKMAAAELEILAPEEVQAEEWLENDEGELTYVGMATNKDGSPRMIKAAGRKLFRNFVKEPKALPFLYQFLKACDPDVELNEAFRFKPAEWIGMELAIKGENQAYNEQVRLAPNKLYPVSKFKG